MSRVEPADESLSLEEWLAARRVERDARRAALAPLVEDLRLSFAVLEVPEPRTPSAPVTERVNPDVLADLASRIVSLGAEGAPLVVPWIDPGPEPDLRERARAAVTVDALKKHSIAAIEPQLLAMLADGTVSGQVNAAALLALSEHPERVGPELVAAYRAATGRVQEALLESIFLLPGKASLELIDEVLRGNDTNQKRIALHALAKLGNERFAPYVREILLDQNTARSVASGLLAYYRTCPESCGREELFGLIGLADNSRVPEVTRLAILEALPSLTSKVDSDLRDALARLRDHRNEGLREATLVALARLGDRRAQREALEPYDIAIERNPEWAIRYVEHGDILYRLEEYNGAIKSYRKALSVGRNDPAPPQGAHIGIAKSYARLGKLKDAAEWLEQAPISTRDLRKLADDPVFAELREHARYGGVFRL